MIDTVSRINVVTVDSYSHVCDVSFQVSTVLTVLTTPTAFALWSTALLLKSIKLCGGSGTFSLGEQWGPWFWVGAFNRNNYRFPRLLRTILCKSLVLMPRVKLVEKIHKTIENMHAKKSIV